MLPDLNRFSSDVDFCCGYMQYFGRAVSAASRTAGQHSSAGHAAGASGAMQRFSHGSTSPQLAHDLVAKQPELEFLQMLSEFCQVISNHLPITSYSI